MAREMLPIRENVYTFISFMLIVGGAGIIWGLGGLLFGSGLWLSILLTEDQIVEAINAHH